MEMFVVFSSYLQAFAKSLINWLLRQISVRTQADVHIHTQALINTHAYVLRKPTAEAATL